MSRRPSEVFLKNGRSLADCMPGSLEGAIVGGKYEPAITSFNVVNSDGQFIAELSVQDLRGAVYDSVMERAKELIPGSDIESVRNRASYVFEEVAKLKATGDLDNTYDDKTRSQIKSNIDDEVAADMLEDELLKEADAPNPRQNTQVNSPRVDREYSPMAALGLKTKQSSLSSRVTGNVNISADVGPPQKLVYFEKEGIGTVPAFFHAVVSALEPTDDSGLEQSGFLVLIYDLRYSQNTARWFPPAYDPYGRPWAVKINDDSYVYLVKTTGFQYVYDNREHCVLMVERAVFSAGE